MDFKPLPNERNLISPIKEILDSRTNRANFIELFEATKENIDLRTDLTIQEIVISNIIKMNGDYLKNLDPSFEHNIYSDFIDEYLRLKVSLDRKSRGEFVDINRSEHFEKDLNKFNNFKQLSDVKK